MATAKEIRMEVRGMREVQENMTQVVKDLTGGPMLMAMRHATLIVQGAARRKAPVDTGRLRASITPEVRTYPDRVEGVVGSNVAYAPHMETGTKPDMPPVDALFPWVHRKRIAGTYSVKTKRRTGSKTTQAQQDRQVAFAIALKIRQRGLAARKYLEQAFEQNRHRIKRLFERAVQKIVG